ncbi:hypothetical protein [Nocardia sp. NPDC057272]|uniref:hypothetical protein n=1 Tax=Nocardia sp. NPDC057272 TaxID=3346079 RepID=UPI00362A37C2
MTASGDTSDASRDAGTDEPRHDVVPGSAPQAAGSAPGIGADKKSGNSVDAADEVDQEPGAPE